MQYDIAPRRSGKTARMIEWMRRAPEGSTLVLACHSKEAAMAALRDYRASLDEGQPAELESWQFVSAEEVVKGRYQPYPAAAGLTRLEFGFDNLDLILQGLVPLSYRIGRATLTEEPEASATWLIEEEA